MKMIDLKQTVDITEIRNLLQRISKIKVGIIGDFCLDVYWEADMTKSELSRETPHFPLPITEERFSLGAAGNVCANICALQPEKIYALGVIGDDWRGMLLKKCCFSMGIDSSMLVCEAGRFTNAYCKPIRQGISPVSYEDPRIDFCTDASISKETEEILINNLQSLDVDVLCVSDQLKNGCITDAVREKINAMGKSGLRVVVDSRDRIGLYRNVILKPNEVEGYRCIFGNNPPPNIDVNMYMDCAKQLSIRTDSAVYMTIGEKGCIYSQNDCVLQVTAAKTPSQVDFVGAGDTFIASLSSALASGADPKEAMLFANICASITIGKIRTTGTASPEEIITATQNQK